MTEPYLHRIMRALAAAGPCTTEDVESFLHLADAKKTYLHNWIRRAADQRLIVTDAEGRHRLSSAGRTRWIKILRLQLRSLQGVLEGPARGPSRPRRRRRCPGAAAARQ